MDTLSLYNLWLDKATDDADLQAELRSLDPVPGYSAHGQGGFFFPGAGTRNGRNEAAGPGLQFHV